MDMECNDVQLLMIDYIDNSLDAASRNEIEKHLLTCEKCSADFAEMKMLLQTVADSKLELPGPALRENFQGMLQSELNRLAAGKNINEKPERKPIALKWSSPLLKIAASIAILILGVLIGSKIKYGRDNYSSAQISDLRSEVKEIKEVLMFSMLKEESASQRIKAVSYAEEINNPNQKVITALIETLNHDKNVNVRLASVYSLAKFSDNQLVRDSLVSSLTRQTEPIIQIVLINILTEKKEIKAIVPIREIILNKNTLKEVKDIAEKNLKLI